MLGFLENVPFIKSPNSGLLFGLLKVSYILSHSKTRGESFDQLLTQST